VKSSANLAAVNYHFGDKERLFSESLRQAHCHFDLHEGDFLPDDLEPATALRAVIRMMMANVLDSEPSRAWQYRLVFREMMQPTPGIAFQFHEIIRPRFERMGAILHRIRPDLQGEALAAHVFSVVGQCLYYRIARTVAADLAGPTAFGHFDVDVLTDHITHFTIAALENPRTLPVTPGAEAH
jgi:AcrR family transcriptional regulator